MWFCSVQTNSWYFRGLTSNLGSVNELDFTVETLTLFGNIMKNMWRWAFGHKHCQASSHASLLLKERHDQKSNIINEMHNCVKNALSDGLKWRQDKSWWRRLSEESALYSENIYCMAADPWNIWMASLYMLSWACSSFRFSLWPQQVLNHFNAWQTS